MMDIDLNSIEEKIADDVTRAYSDPVAPHYPYHNIDHTKAVVTHCREIAAYYSLGRRETFILIAAAWFHDIGHLYGSIEGHEERGVGIMQKSLIEAPRELTAAIATCILATRLPSHPHLLSEKIICDADTYHLGTELFRETDPLVHREIELRKGMAIADWSGKTLTMLRRHMFFTDYCKTLLAKGKEDNIAWVEAQLAESAGRSEGGGKDVPKSR